MFKDSINFVLMLTLSEGTKGFVVYCDAYHVGLGCVIIQHGKVIAMLLGNIRYMRDTIPLMTLS